MKNTSLIASFFAVFLATSINAVEIPPLSNGPLNHSLASLQQQKWIHGSHDCKANKDPAIEVFQYDKSSYILRQNKCLGYEAPFIYVLVGDEKILVVDTGSTENAKEFPLFETIQSINQKHSSEEKTSEREVLVIHSHSHSDHYAADPQFKGQPNVTVVPANYAGINQFFVFENWPNKQTSLELGGRSITIIPTPGHQEEAISIYDTQTKWLLTGDTLFPGHIYVKNWEEYKNSIARLTLFASNHSVSAVLGAHIEMTNRVGEYYEVGTIFQPDEAPLPLSPLDLAVLNTKLNQTDKPQKISLDGLIVEPLGALPKLISAIAKWFIR